MSNITDLTGSTWLFKDTIRCSSFDYLITFTDNNDNVYNEIIGDNDTLSFGTNGTETQVYNNTWESSDYQVITINSGVDTINPLLIAWLYANATFLKSEIYLSDIKIHRVPSFQVWKDNYNKIGGIGINDLVIMSPEGWEEFVINGGSGGGGEMADVFVATYGETTYQQIKNAYDNGKLCVVKTFSSSFFEDESKIYYLTHTNSFGFTFVSYSPYTLRWVYIDSSNDWSNDSLEVNRFDFNIYDGESSDTYSAQYDFERILEEIEEGREVIAHYNDGDYVLSYHPSDSGIYSFIQLYGNGSYTVQYSGQSQNVEPGAELDIFEYSTDQSYGWIGWRKTTLTLSLSS